MNTMQAENLVKRYGVGETAVTAVRGINFGMEEGEFIAIMGESGSGKSTLLSMLGALNTPTEGRYLVDDIDVYALGSEQRAEFRREFLGFVFQSFHLIPYLSLIENVMLPVATIRMSARQKRAMAETALDRVGLADKAKRLPNQISGGEQERAAIARAIVNEPPLLLADEPTGNLDTKTGREIMRLFQGLNRDGVTIIMVTHSHDAAEYADRFLRISDGRLTEDERHVKTYEITGQDPFPEHKPMARFARL
ncbi:MAG: ABC transporter ATP-binding protein [Deltaproteobacteria bacterium]|nr:ABC transporter ATP-binding protein [Deltaproteobacteria bacterium]